MICNWDFLYRIRYEICKVKRVNLKHLSSFLDYRVRDYIFEKDFFYLQIIGCCE